MEIEIQEKNAELTGTVVVGTEGTELVIKLFSSSAQLSMKFQVLIDVEIVKIS